MQINVSTNRFCRSTAQHNEYTSIGSLFKDAHRCLQMCFEEIKHHSLNTYHSALIWVPKKSLIRNKYRGLLGSLPKVLIGLMESWGAFENIMYHPQRVVCMSFSPDGTRVVSGTYDQSVRIWNAITGEIECELKGHSGVVESAMFSPDRTCVVSGSRDKLVRI